MVPALLLLLMLVVVAVASALPDTGAQPTLHPSRPYQRAKQCPRVTPSGAPKTESQGLNARKSHSLAILKNSHTYSEAIPFLHTVFFKIKYALSVPRYSCTLQIYTII